MHVHCPVCKQGQISYVIRSHIDQNTQDSGLRLELQRKMDFHTKKRDRSYKGKKATISQKKGMAHRKRAWRSKKRAWRSAMLKGPRGNTKKVRALPKDWPTLRSLFSGNLIDH